MSWLPKLPNQPSGGGGRAFGGGGGGSTSGGGGATAYRPSGSAGNFQAIKNPWEQAMWANYNKSKENPYANQWSNVVGQASRLGNRNYEGDLRRLAQEDVQRQITAADNQLGQLGMRELALKGDVQADRSKMLADASTRAMIESQGIKSNAIDTFRNTVATAQGADLDRLSQMINAAATGASNYMQFTPWATDLQERAGAAAASRKAENDARNAASYSMYLRHKGAGK